MDCFVACAPRNDENKRKGENNDAIDSGAFYSADLDGARGGASRGSG
jgi:hypothetical protein